MALTICEMFQKDYLKKPIWQTMIEIEKLLNERKQL